MRTACKACGAVRENKLTADHKKVTCEACGVEIASTSALRSLLVKRGLVQENAIVWVPEKAPAQSAQPKEVKSITDKRVKMSAAEEEEFRKRYAGPASDDLALKRRPDSDGTDVQARRVDPSAPVVQRPDTPGARQARENAARREQALRQRNQAMNPNFKQKIETVRAAGFADGLAANDLDVDTANALFDQAIDDVD